MALNSKYITAPSLQQYFVDKDTGAPLSGGFVHFYSDVNRTVRKDVFQLQGNQANYTYVPLPNPVQLSGVGTIQDNNGNDVIPYYYPFNENDENEPELYYIVVTNSIGVPQLTRQAWPNPGDTRGGASGQEDFNYIPNGQMLAHTELPDNLLLPGLNVIAQGGINILLADPLQSENTLQFEASPNADNAPGSPRYIARFQCTTANANDTIKAITIRFRDVNKFSSEENPTYTFGFWTSSNVEIPFSAVVYRFYGTNGDMPDQNGVAVGTIPAAPFFTTFNVNFGQNVGKQVDTVNNDDYVEIRLELSTSIGFDLRFTDFVLVTENPELSTFPIQTNADMLTRGVPGWVNTPNPDGSDLYLPMVLTREGMTFDDSGIGKIFADIGDVPAPSSPNATTNELPCDGANYISSEYSALGIPYSRLRDKLIEKSPIANYPLFGTGAQYATALPMGVDTLLLTVNIPGTPIAAGAVGTSPFDFNTSVAYGGSSVGRNTIGFVSRYDTSNTLRARSTTFLQGTQLNSVNAGTSGFTVSDINYEDGLYAQQTRYAFEVQTVSAAALANPGGVARYFEFSSDTLNFRVWYRITDETQPVAPAPPAPAEYIQINLNADYSAADVAYVTSNAINAYQMTRIDIIALPTQNPGPPAPADYFTFQTNPGALRNFYVWYKYTDNDQDPSLANQTGIRVDLDNTDTTTTVTTKTIAAINAQEFAVPDLRGLFLRGADFTGTWDLDRFSRFGFGNGLGGNNYGTYEWSQIINHLHSASTALTIETFSNGTPGGTQCLDVAPRNPTWNTLYSRGTAVTTIGDTGGSETRPVNAYVNWVMKY